MRNGTWFGLLAVSLGTTACLLLHDLDALEGVTGDDSDDASRIDSDGPVVADDAGFESDATSALDGSVSDAGDGGPSCAGHAGPTPVVALGFCVDSTEVTVAQYADFLAAKAGDTSGQEQRCEGNTTFAPAFGIPPATENARSIRYVDFCDAVAYCTWAGKRVCRARDGGTVAHADHANAQVSEWFAACSRNDDGVHGYPYGTDWAPGRCNDSAAVAARDGGPSQSAPGDYPDCTGGYAGALDMSGNTGEWEDGCFVVDGGLSCPLRGGSWYHDNMYSLSCAGGEYGAPDNQTPGWGIRCCSDLN